MAYRFNFPPVATSAEHTRNSGVTHYTPTLDIDDVSGCCTAYGQEPNKVLSSVWEAERSAGGQRLTALEKIELIKKLTGIDPINA